MTSIKQTGSRLVAVTLIAGLIGYILGHAEAESPAAAAPSVLTEEGRCTGIGPSCHPVSLARPT